MGGDFSKYSKIELSKVKKDILELENKYEYLNSDFSPSKTIGYKPSKNFRTSAILGRNSGCTFVIRSTN